MKYVFLDIVRFSADRSAEAQVHIIDALNRMVLECIAEYSKKSTLKLNSICLPTGDGVCIGLHSRRFDCHITLALRLLEFINSYNDKTTDEMRKFQVRIGINQNTDVVFTDINGHQNLAGAGINDASRIMDFAEGNQVFVSQVAYDELRPSEQYMGKFRAYRKVVKHNVQVTAYQFVGEGYSGLNTDVPAEFREKEKKDEKLSQLEAYYFAHAIRLRPEIVRILNDSTAYKNGPGFRVFLYLCALDSMERAKAVPMNPYNGTYIQPPIDDALRVYTHSDGNTALFAFGLMIREVFLKKRYDYFDSYNLYDLTPEGEKKLKADWPEIYKQICEST